MAFMRFGLWSLMIIACALAGCGDRHRAPDARLDAGGPEADGSVRDDDGSNAQPPIAIDRPSFVQTSGKQLLLRRPQGTVDGGVTDVFDLLALDLESEQLHEVASAKIVVGAELSAPASRVYMFSVGGPRSLEPDEDEGLFIARLADDGVMAPRRLSEALDRAVEYSAEWDNWLWPRTLIAQGRFALLKRRVGTIDGVDVIDLRTGALHGQFDFNTDADQTWWYAEPDGSWFLHSGSGHSEYVELTRIAVNGLERTEVISNDLQPDLHPDLITSSRVIFPTGGGDERKYFYSDLPIGEPIPIEALPDGDNTLQEIVALLPDRDYAIGAFGHADGPSVLRRVSLMTGASISLSDNAVHDLAFIELVMSSDKGIVLLLDDVMNGTARSTGVVDPVDASLIAYLPEGASLTGYGAAGARHAYVATSDGVLVIGRDEAGTLQTALLDTDVLDCKEGGRSRSFAMQPGNRLASVYGSSMALIDLDEALAVDAGSIATQHGGYLSCPTWNAEGTAFAYGEQLTTDGETQSWLYVVRWPKDGSPSEPELVFSDEGAISVVLAEP